MKDTLQKLKNNIIEAFELYDLSDDEQEKFIVSVAKSVLETSIVRALTVMPEESHGDYEMYLATGPKPEEVYNYLTKNVPIFPQILEEELAEFVKISNQISDKIENKD